MKHSCFAGTGQYYRWLIQTTRGKKHVPTRKYYGLASFIISILFLSLSFKNLFNTILNFLANMFISAPSGTSLDAFGTGTVNYLSLFKHNGFLSGLLLISISFIILIGIGMLTCHFISHQSVNLWAYINRLATLTNGALPLELFGLFLTIIGHGFKLVILLDLIVVVLYQLGTVDTLWNCHFKNLQSRLYVTTTVICLYPLLFLLVLYILIMSSH